MPRVCYSVPWYIPLQALVSALLTTMLPDADGTRTPIGGAMLLAFTSFGLPSYRKAIDFPK